MSCQNKFVKLVHLFGFVIKEKDIQTFFYIINILGVKASEETKRDDLNWVRNLCSLISKTFAGNKQRVRGDATAIYVCVKEAVQRTAKNATDWHW
jgi:hypothetical protein